MRSYLTRIRFDVIKAHSVKCAAFFASNAFLSSSTRIEKRKTRMDKYWTEPDANGRCNYVYNATQGPLKSGDRGFVDGEERGSPTAKEGKCELQFISTATRRYNVYRRRSQAQVPSASFKPGLMDAEYEKIRRRAGASPWSYNCKNDLGNKACWSPAGGSRTNVYVMERTDKSVKPPHCPPERTETTLEKTTFEKEVMLGEDSTVGGRRRRRGVCQGNTYRLNPGYHGMKSVGDCDVRRLFKVDKDYCGTICDENMCKKYRQDWKTKKFRGKNRYNGPNTQTFKPCKWNVESRKCENGPNTFFWGKNYGKGTPCIPRNKAWVGEKNYYPVGRSYQGDWRSANVSTAAQCSPTVSNVVGVTLGSPRGGASTAQKSSSKCTCKTVGAKIEPSPECKVNKEGEYSKEGEYTDITPCYIKDLYTGCDTYRWSSHDNAYYEEKSLTHFNNKKLQGVVFKHTSVCKTFSTIANHTNALVTEGDKRIAYQQMVRSLTLTLALIAHP